MSRFRTQLQIRTGSFEYKSALKQSLYAATKEMEEAVRRKFTTQQASWPRLSAMTQKQRLLLGYNPLGPKLIRTGSLINERSVTYRKVTSTEAIIGSTDDRAIKLNNGEGKIPARPFYNLTESDWDKVIEVVGNRLERDWKIRK